MSKEMAILDQASPRGNPAWALSDEEVFLLMRNFTADNVCVTEDDALTVVQWAQAQRLGAVILQMVLEGDLAVVVDGGEVQTWP